MDGMLDIELPTASSQCRQLRPLGEQGKARPRFLLQQTREGLDSYGEFLPWLGARGNE
jgi:hypothetical protein